MLELNLLPQRAVWAPSSNALFVTDTHFRKSAAAIPDTSRMLQELSRLIEEFSPKQLVILGDWIHQSEPAEKVHPLIMKALTDWRSHWCDLSIACVKGNHDHKNPALLEQLRFVVYPEGTKLDGFELWHYPLPPDEVPTQGDLFQNPSSNKPFDCLSGVVVDSYSSSTGKNGVKLKASAGNFRLCGHLHPCAISIVDKQRLPCFVLSSRQLILPAFNDSLRMTFQTPSPQRLLFASDGDGVQLVV